MGNTTELERGAEAGTSAEAVQAKLNKGEERVLSRLRRAKLVATLAAPELVPTLDDLVEIAELIEDEGG